MPDLFNVYCDESCHLENDQKQIMVLGAIWCPRELAKGLSNRFREIKIKHDLNRNYELKWTKVSSAKISYYQEVISLFFSSLDLHYRALVALNKDNLRHEDFHQTHDTWYYKMYFCMLKAILDPNARYRIFIDIKDTKSGDKLKTLHNVLSNSILDFSRNVIQSMQTIRSHESELIQVVDLLTGALSYHNRDLSSSPTKNELVKFIKMRSNYSLKASTLVRENKFNLFIWKPKEEEQQ
jgi:hypothetical protein